jgi:uncharacterized membrane protein YvlD (DUF360 family)
MTRFLIRLFLVAFSLYVVLPMLPGFKFHGNFLHAIGAGLFFSVLAWIVEFLAIAISAILAIGTLGVGLIVLIPAWLLGFWLLPAVVLKLLADLLPGYITIVGWEPAIWGGLVMLLIGVITSKETKRFRRRNSAGSTEDDGDDRA